jgi:hypothetical protein
MSIHEAARKASPDVEAVHGDITALLDAGALRRTPQGGSTSRSTPSGSSYLLQAAWRDTSRTTASGRASAPVVRPDRVGGPRSRAEEAAADRSCGRGRSCHRPDRRAGPRPVAEPRRWPLDRRVTGPHQTFEVRGSITGSRETRIVRSAGEKGAPADVGAAFRCRIGTDKQRLDAGAAAVWSETRQSRLPSARIAATSLA